MKEGKRPCEKSHLGNQGGWAKKMLAQNPGGYDLSKLKSGAAVTLGFHEKRLPQKKTFSSVTQSKGCANYKLLQETQTKNGEELKGTNGPRKWLHTNGDKPSKTGKKKNVGNCWRFARHV